ncbi:4-amino-4-deoxy-L-arabinose transferase [Rubidibacter lacunae KORDI 51-2]|uniref:4-amino-4-deoxy-L-arabinose transferase n=1 Tax=Rubidibacter lacunae KORDI 51-2 TaxID=582515 RepID=U5DRE8_9CHRO|nr:glycosyltransferase family 39 protein [Rubidibacter lacunae]ERN43184.1 4-amino-4-deoxy-L-arabinose transferase [Rubidibacter lacunae KORDI 51-2]
MSRQAFAWDRARQRVRQRLDWSEGAWIVGLFIAAIALATVNLGGVPLRDWDEGIVAQVAREIWIAPSGSQHWLFPTLWGKPYLNKPPLVHNLVALAYRFGGSATAWTARFPGALLTALSVPLLYGVGCELFPTRRPALLAALVYLTTLPVIRHGRLAMLDGALTCFAILTLWCVLRSRRDARWSLGIGLGLSLMVLTKGIAGLLVGAILGAFVLWDTPRLFLSLSFWCGLTLGSAPAIAWYAAQWSRYAETFAETALWAQSAERIWSTVDEHAEPPWFYLLQMLRSLPWLVVAAWGLNLAGREHPWSWARLVMVWCGLYFTAVTLMSTKLYWYVLPIYPGLALAAGAALADLECRPAAQPYPKFWALGAAGLSLTAAVYGLHLVQTNNNGITGVVIAVACLALTQGMSALLLWRRDPQFIAILFWGTYVSLFVFFSTPAWLWELEEAFPVLPVAAEIHNLPVSEPVYIAPKERPSLSFYSGRRVMPVSADNACERWHAAEAGSHFLLDPETLAALQFESLPGREIGPKLVMVRKLSAVEDASIPVAQCQPG